MYIMFHLINQLIVILLGKGPYKIWANKSNGTGKTYDMTIATLTQSRCIAIGMYETYVN